MRLVSGEYVPDPSQNVLDQLTEISKHILSRIPDSVMVRLGLFTRDGSDVMTFVISGVREPLNKTPLVSPDVSVEIHESDDETLVEVSWSHQ